MKQVQYECGCTAGGDLISPHCPMCGYPAYFSGSEQMEKAIDQAAERYASKSYTSPGSVPDVVKHQDDMKMLADAFIAYRSQFNAKCNMALDFENKLKEWQATTGFSHPEAAAEELRRLRSNCRVFQDALTAALEELGKLESIVVEDFGKHGTDPQLVAVVRPAVRWMAEQMERRLLVNKSRSKMPRPQLHECTAAIRRNMYSLVETMRCNPENSVEDDIADCGNWLLMLVGKDVNDTGRLPDEFMRALAKSGTAPIEGAID